MDRRYLVELYDEHRRLIAEAYFDLDQNEQARRFMDAQEKHCRSMIMRTVDVCPHRIKFEDCDVCHLASDFSYDTWRENR